MANDFSSDPNCVALWKMDSGGITVDSKGGNTLTDNNTCGTDGVDYKEGDQSLDLDRSANETLSITDANLDFGFPFKSGDTNKKISFCFWFKKDVQANWVGIFTKWDTSAKRQYSVYMGGSDEKDIIFAIGYNSGTSAEEILVHTNTTTGVWYHLGITFQDSDKSYKAVLWDDNAGSKIADLSGNSTNNMYVTDAMLIIGGLATSGAPNNSYDMDGHIDEVVVFKDILTGDEIDQIRQGTYGAAAPAGFPWHTRGANLGMQRGMNRGMMMGN